MPENIADYEKSVSENVEEFKLEWKTFIQRVETEYAGKYFKKFVDKETGEVQLVFSEARWCASQDFGRDIFSYFYENKKELGTIIFEAIEK